MGTYMKCYLKDRTDENIKPINDALEKLGVQTEMFNGIKFGAFTTIEELKEDARFMNEEPEGLKQMPDWKRPITTTTLSQLFWKHIGGFVTKISANSEEEMKDAVIVSNWAKKNIKLIDTKKSENFLPSFVSSYLSGGG
jgi:hypothetical protein